MSKQKELAIKALEQMRGDDFYRCSKAFKNYTFEQMNEEHGESGRTRAEILHEYYIHEKNVNEAIEWVKAQDE